MDITGILPALTGNQPISMRYILPRSRETGADYLIHRLTAKMNIHTQVWMIFKKNSRLTYRTMPILRKALTDHQLCY